MPVSEAFLIDNREYMKGISDKFFDLACVDPPYRDTNDPTQSMRKINGDGRMTNFGKKPDAEYFKELFRISKNQIVFGANNFIENLYSTNCMIFWYKQNPMPNYSDGEFAWTSFNSVSKCFNYRYHGNHDGHTTQSGKIHPTQKPIALYRWLLKNYASEGDKIFDSHMGSQSSRIAAYQMGFDYYGCEIDPDYFKDGCERFKLVTSQTQMQF